MYFYKEQNYYPIEVTVEDVPSSIASDTDHIRLILTNKQGTYNSSATTKTIYKDITYSTLEADDEGNITLTWNVGQDSADNIEFFNQSDFSDYAFLVIEARDIGNNVLYILDSQRIRLKSIAVS